MLAMLGWLLILVGTIWLVVTAIQTGKTTGGKVLWALVTFLCEPLGGIVFYFVQKQGMIPLLLVIIGWVLMVVGGGMSMFSALSR